MVKSACGMCSVLAASTKSCCWNWGTWFSCQCYAMNYKPGSSANQTGTTALCNTGSWKLNHSKRGTKAAAQGSLAQLVPRQGWTSVAFCFSSGAASLTAIQKKLCGMLARHAHSLGCHHSCVTTPLQSTSTALGLVGVLLVVFATGMVVLPR